MVKAIKAQSHFFKANRYVLSDMGRDIQARTYGKLGKRKVKVGFTKATLLQRFCHSLFRRFTKAGRGWVCKIRLEDRTIRVNRKSFEKYSRALRGMLALHRKVSEVNRRMDNLLNPQSTTWSTEPLSMQNLREARSRLIEAASRHLPMIHRDGSSAFYEQKYAERHPPEGRDTSYGNNTAHINRLQKVIRALHEDKRVDTDIPLDILERRLEELKRSNYPLRTPNFRSPFPTARRAGSEEPAKSPIERALASVQNYRPIDADRMPQSLHKDILVWNAYVRQDQIKLEQNQVREEFEMMSADAAHYERMIPRLEREIAELNQAILLARKKERALPPLPTERSQGEIRMAREEVEARIETHSAIVRSNQARLSQISRTSALLNRIKREERKDLASRNPRHQKIIKEGFEALAKLDVEARVSFEKAEQLQSTRESLLRLITECTDLRENAISKLQSAEEMLMAVREKSLVCAERASVLKKKREQIDREIKDFAVNAHLHHLMAIPERMKSKAVCESIRLLTDYGVHVLSPERFKLVEDLQELIAERDELLEPMRRLNPLIPADRAKKAELEDRCRLLIDRVDWLSKPPRREAVYRYMDMFDKEHADVLTRDGFEMALLKRLAEAYQDVQINTAMKTLRREGLSDARIHQELHRGLSPLKVLEKIESIRGQIKKVEYQRSALFEEMMAIHDLGSPKKALFRRELRLLDQSLARLDKELEGWIPKSDPDVPDFDKIMSRFNALKSGETVATASEAQSSPVAADNSVDFDELTRRFNALRERSYTTSSNRSDAHSDYGSMSSGHETDGSGSFSSDYTTMSQ